MGVELNDVCSATGIKGLRYFMHLMDLSGVDGSREIAGIAHETIAAIKANVPYPPELKCLENRWYSSVRESKNPDYSVYVEDKYLAEVWACWDIYSRKYLREIRKPSSLPPFGMVRSFGEIKTVVDLGNGLGISTAALKQIFPLADVYGTNVNGSAQWRIASKIASLYRFNLIEDLSTMPGIADLVFASEYFEHFQDPIAHLDSVLSSIRPGTMLIANTFTSDAIGHFDEYVVGKEKIPGKKMGAIFSKRMTEHGYKKIKTKLWNNRPTLWRLGG